MADQAPGGEFWVVAEALCSTIRDGGGRAHRQFPRRRMRRTSLPGLPERGAGRDDRAGTAFQYADNPGRQPEVAYAGNSAVSPCQARIYAAEVLPADAAEPGENEAGKIAVAVTAPSGRDDDLTVTVGGQQAEVAGDFNVPDPGDGLTTVVVLFDGNPDQVTLEVSNGRGPMSTSVQLPGTGDTDTDTDTDTDDRSRPAETVRRRTRVPVGIPR